MIEYDTALCACAALPQTHHLLLIVDNTFLSPYLQNPINLIREVGYIAYAYSVTKIFVSFDLIVCHGCRT